MTCGHGGRGGWDKPGDEGGHRHTAVHEAARGRLSLGGCFMQHRGLSSVPVTTWVGEREGVDVYTQTYTHCRPTSQLSRDQLNTAKQVYHNKNLKNN